MRKVLLVVVVVAAVVLAVSSGPSAQAGAPCIVPKEWGRLAAVTERPLGATILTFEAEDGTVRLIPVGCKMPAKAIDTVGRQ